MAGIFTHNGNIIQGLPSLANQVVYNNTNSGLHATQVQSAIDELTNKKQEKTDNTLSTTSKLIAGAINELNSGKQNVTDNTLTTTDKTVPGAINEIKSSLLALYAEQRQCSFVSGICDVSIPQNTVLVAAIGVATLDAVYGYTRVDGETGYRLFSGNTALTETRTVLLVYAGNYTYISS